MPRYPIERSTNFIVENESWNTVEYDHTSVPGLIYVSLTENKINSIYDDSEENYKEKIRLLFIKEFGEYLFDKGDKVKVLLEEING